jgi:uncharacterized Fe-S cluster-containing radical SAM superfamily enzyme
MIMKWINENKKSLSLVGRGWREVSKLKEAIKNALNAANADVLVEPQFTVEGNGNAIKITVKGYPAKYENFKSAEPSDIDNTAVKQGNVQVVKPQPVAEQPKKKGGTIWAIISGILIVAVAAVAAAA